jgi:ABC-type sugar transport system permease subunit
VRDLKHFGIASGLVVLATLVLASILGVVDRARTSERQYLVAARAAGWVYEAERTLDDPPEDVTQRFLRSMLEVVPGLEHGFVLRKTKVSHHSDPEQAGRRLDRDSLADKALFDDARAMKSDVDKNVEEREKKPELSFEPYPEARVLRPPGGQLLVRVPAKSDDRMDAMVELGGRPPRVPLGLPYLVFLVAALAVGAYAGVRTVLKGTPRVMAGNVLVAAVAVVSVMVLVAQWRHDKRASALEAEQALVDRLVQLDLAAVTPTDERGALVRELSLDARGRSIRTLDEIGDQGSTPSTSYLAEAAAQDRSTLVPWSFAFLLLGPLVFSLGALGQSGRAWGALVEHRRAYGYLSPAMMGLAILVFIPVTYGIVLGFTNRVYNDFQFAGLKNYFEILTDLNVSSPTNFYFTLGVTIMWTVLNVFLHVSIGLFLALLLNDHLLRARGVFRVLFIVPWAVPNYITALIWKQMFHNEFGAINHFLAYFGVEPISWFQTFWTAFFTNLATNTWLGFPFMMVVSLGALQSIPDDLYEAAFVDGASRWQRFKDITLPLLMPALVPAVIVGSVWTFNMFNIIYLVSGGAPNGATDILITEAFRWAFERDSYGYAAAYSTIIFVILLVFTMATNRITGATKGAFE